MQLCHRSTWVKRLPNLQREEGALLMRFEGTTRLPLCFMLSLFKTRGGVCWQGGSGTTPELDPVHVCDVEKEADSS